MSVGRALENLMLLLFLGGLLIGAFGLYLGFVSDWMLLVTVSATVSVTLFIQAAMLWLVLIGQKTVGKE